LNIYFETLQNLSRKIDNKTIKFPDTYSLGINTNIILNPKFSLSLDFIETYQTKMSKDNQKINPSTIIYQMGFGFTYNINSKNAIIASTLVGTSPQMRLVYILYRLLLKNTTIYQKAIKINLKILKTIKIPVIARIARDRNYPHFVVIKGFKNFILVLDPNYGKYILSFDEFNKIWTKYIFIVKLKYPKNIEYNLTEFFYIKDLY